MALFGLLGTRRRPEDRMHEMMQRLGVDGVALAEGRPGEDLAAAAHECSCCSKVATCEKWLDGKAEGANPYAFCPNGALFADHRREE